MRKFFKLLFLAIAIGSTITAVAQKPATKKSTNTTSQHSDSESTKIDVTEAPPEEMPALDTAAAPNDELTAELTKMLNTTHAVDLGIAVARRMIAQEKASATEERMQTFYDRFFRELGTDRVHRLFQNMFIKIYRNYYTVDEAKQLNQFYETPTGKKTLQVTPLAMADSQKQGEKLGEMLAHEIIRQMDETKN